LERIQPRRQQLNELQAQRQWTLRPLSWTELRQQERFSQLASAQKHVVDTIKLMAYWAERALVAWVREKLARVEDVRLLVWQVASRAAELCLAMGQGTLTVRLHRLGSGNDQVALEQVCVRS
jgi:hypothetical protein